MRTAFYGVLVVLMAMGLAACGSEPNQPPDNSSGNNPPSSPVGGFEFLHYAVKLTGAATAQAEGAGQAVVQSNAQRFVSLGGVDLGFQVTLQLPAAAQVGIYTLAAGTGEYRIEASTSSEESGQYTANGNGTLEITASEPLQGRFEYSAANSAGESLNVTGSFYEVVYTFSATVTGAVNATIPPGQASAVVFGEDYALSLQTPNTDSVFSITFYLPTSVASGTYALASNTAEAQPGQIGVSINNNGKTATLYDQGIAGTLTLSEVGQQYTGTFKVIAASSDDKNVTVEGAFEEIPLLAAEGGA